MALLQDLVPKNLLEEKARFFADQTYNPQFIYKEPILPESLAEYGVPQKKYLDLAISILEKTYFGRN